MAISWPTITLGWEPTVILSARWDKRREALGKITKRLLYCVNVSRTSLDHLLLGGNADIDEMSHDSSITRIVSQ